MIDFEQVGEKIYFSYVDSNGDINIRNFRLSDNHKHNWTYCHEDDPRASRNFRSWNGKAIKKTRANYLDKFRQFDLMDQFTPEIEQQVFSPHKPKMYFMDIEVDVDDRGFPYANIARMPVNTIAFSTPHHRVFVLGIKPLDADTIERIENRINRHLEKLGTKWKFSYKYYETEYKMLDDFANKYMPMMPAITGWNFVDFDWQYLVNRCKQYNINLASKASPTSNFNDRTLLPYHRLVFDYLEIYKKWDRVVKIKESNKLDWVAEHVLGVKKVKYSGTLVDLWKNDLEDYVFYNAVDTCLVHELDKSLNTFETFQAISSVGKVPQLKAFSAVYITERLMHTELKKRGMRLVRDQNRIIEDGGGKGYDGAFVMEPIAGLHPLVAVLDFASMYPMLMRQFNIGSEVYLGKLTGEGYFFNEKTKLKQKFDPTSHVMTSADTVFDKTEDSVIRNIVTDLYDSRYDMKHKASTIKREIAMLKKMR